MRHQTIAWGLCLCLMFASAGAAHAQNSMMRGQAQMVRADFSPASADADQAQQRMAQEMAKRANLERQARMKTDADKLFELATELKNSVDKTNANILSLDVIKKAQEIEKLAHSVKEKMKGPN